jgi:hypothetical protein
MTILIEKSELAGGHFPSQKFGANAAWWQIMVLALKVGGSFWQFLFLTFKSVALLNN